MALTNYGVLKGMLKYAIPYRESYKDEPYYYLVLDTNNGSEKVAIIARSKGKKKFRSEVMFHIDMYFNHPIISRLQILSLGFHKHLSLDYWRDSRLLNIRRMTPLSSLKDVSDNDLNPIISKLLHVSMVNQKPQPYTLVAPNNTDLREAYQPSSDNVAIYAFGDRLTTNDGICATHLNQGNPKGSELEACNGIYQDGGLIVECNGEWKALFIAFQQQQLPTDIAGFPTQDARQLL
jgi:uncharacterized protein YukJ